MSTPSRGRRGKSLEKGKSAKKQIAVKQTKYASKFVEQVLDEINSSVLNETPKNQVSSEWVRKMTKSILKKISEDSRVASNSTSSSKVDDIQQEIEELQQKITNQFAKLKENPNKRASITLIPAVPKERAYSSGLYEAQFQAIQNKVQKLSDEINSAQSAAKARLESMEETVAAVRNNAELFLKYTPMEEQAIVQPTNDVNDTSIPKIGTDPSQFVTNVQDNNTNHNNGNKANNAGGRKRSHGHSANKQDPLHKMVEHLG